MVSLSDLMSEVRSRRVFDTALNLKVYDGESRLAVITGPNCSGKSVFRKVLHGVCNDRSILYVNTSLEDRCNSSGLKRIMMYGTETDESTGYNSAKGFLKALQSSQSYERQHVLFFDEPDVGLADEYCAAMGHRLAQFVTSTPEQCLGVFLVTHNRHLVRPLLPLRPYHAALGTQPLTLEQWAAREIVPGDLDSLLVGGRETWHKVQEVINKRKAGG